VKKNDLPQDKSALENFTREVCYVKNEEGKYETGLSTGWDTKKIALDRAWEDIEKRVEEAKHKVRSGEASPVLYFMELKLMDLDVLAGYSGFWKWQIKHHFKPSVFKNLSEKKIQKYAHAFDVSVDELKNFKNT